MNYLFVLLCLRFFNIQPQFYGFQPVDEVIRQRLTGEARTGYAAGFNPWLLTYIWNVLIGWL
jgi:hypothetical protein